MRVLVAEDQTTLAGLIATGLRRHGMVVDVVCRGDEADELLAVNDYDVVVLDRDLPGLHGDVVARNMIARGALTRILMLTASGTLQNKVDGLDLGADDYLAKPFEYAELVARVRALARRARPAMPPVLSKSGITVDVTRHQATRDGIPLDLSPKEFTLLTLLLQADGAVVSAEALLEKGWDSNADPFSAAVRVTMSKLRTKLGEPCPIRTVIGKGYSL